MGRFSFLAVLVLVLGVMASGCGRKGDLQPPPDDDRERRQTTSK